jgi:hypothetical protein
VQVKTAKGGCGCTETFPGRKLLFTLRPLEAVDVTVALDTETKHGPVTQTIRIITHDNPAGTPLTLSGTVQPGNH